MVLRGAEAPRALDDKAYGEMQKRGRGVKKRWGKEEDRNKRRVTCGICGKDLAQGSLQRHMELVHGEKRVKYRGRKKEEGENSG